MGGTIMVIDGSDHFRRTAGELLAVRGYTLLRVTADPDTALAAAASGSPDGVLLDIDLPGHDGIAVAAKLASACPSARIVLTSCDYDDIPAGLLAACGATAFVPKTELAVADLEELFTPRGT